MMPRYILVTGASGFLGQALCTELTRYAYAVRGVFRSRASAIALGADSESIIIKSMHDKTNWSAALRNVDVVVHLAARVHVMNDAASDPLAEFRLINVEGTLNLAREASKIGVKRFIFLSSIKVNGECTQFGRPFTADQIPIPSDPYGISKYEAEIGLRALSKETGMEVVIIRSPLIYGPGVKANFLSIMNWLWRGIPLPLGGVTKNRRSFVFIDNIASMIISCINHPAAANETFFVSDDEDLSTAELLERMALALGRPTKLIAVPTALIMLGARLIGRSDISQRLCGSLQVDIKKTKDFLSWSPPVSVDEGLRQTATHFLKMRT